MRRRLLSVALMVTALAGVGGIGAGVYATGGDAEVFGLASSRRTLPPPTLSPPTTAPAATVTPTAGPTPTPSPVSDPISGALLAGTELLKPGSSGAAVKALETRLQSLKFDIAAPDTEFDDTTAHAVMAFQKVVGLDRDGVAGPLTRKALANPPPAVSITPLVTGAQTPAGRVEVDMDRQLLVLYQRSEVTRIISVSTGSGQWFTVDKEFRVSIAVTNSGAFKVYRTYPDWEEGPLGSLYKPVYFDGGIAIHGYPSVPPYPASHGCVRTPLHTQDWLFPVLVDDFPIYVFGESPPAETERPPEPTRPPDTTAGPATDTASSTTAAPVTDTPPATTAPATSSTTIVAAVTDTPPST